MALRNPWFLVWMSVFAPVFVLLIGGVTYWNAANQLPAYVRPPVVLPEPNAYDDYAAAAAMCRAAGGSGVGYAARQVPPGRLRAVVMRNRAALARLRRGFGKEYSLRRWSRTSRRFRSLPGTANWHAFWWRKRSWPGARGGGRISRAAIATASASG